MRDHRKIISAYDRFVPFRLLQLLGKKDITEIQLGDQIEKRITVLFADIRDFTTLSESMTPQENFNFINAYLSQMEPLISVHDGIVDKYIGDAIMAVFPGNTNQALDCALAMLKQLEIFNESRARAGYPEINIGIGLNTGLAMIGTVGGYNRMEGTVISDSVNLCARIESLTKAYGAELLISESTYHDLSASRREWTRFIDRVLVKGKHRPHSIYEVFSSAPEVMRNRKREQRELFEEALAHYHYRNVDTAAKLLRQCIAENPEDFPAQKYLDRCEEFFLTGQLYVATELGDRIEWNDSFLIGHEEIDRQHHELVEGSLELLDAIEKGAGIESVKKMISSIIENTKEHFRTEEAIMKETDYPLLEIQKRQHASFIQAVSGLYESLSDARVFMMFRTQILLVDWLVNHTMKDDRHFGKFLNYLAT